MINQDIEWSQDLTSLQVKIPLKRTIKSKIQITAYSNFLKVYHSERNFLRIIDTFAPIQYDSMTWDYLDNYVSVSVQKESPRLWDSFEAIGKSKLELKQMRKTAIDEKEEADHKKASDLQSLKKNLNQMAYEQKTDLDKALREKGEEIKNSEMAKALDYIHGEDSGKINESIETSALNTKETGIRNSPDPNWPRGEKAGIENLNTANSLSPNSHGDDLDERIEKALEIEYEPSNALLSAKDKVQIKLKSKGSSNEANSLYQRPKMTEPIQLNFTQRVFPALAMREQHLLQIPTAKGSKPNEKVDGMNHIALKERGDYFFKNQDYPSAILAYEESLKLKQDSLRTLLNFSTLYIKTLNLEKAEEKLYLFKAAYELLDEIGKSVKENQNLLLNAHKKEIIIKTLKGDLESSVSLIKQLQRMEGVDEGAYSDDLKKLECRLDSEKLKHEGDIFFQKDQFALAIERYEKALQSDSTNEKIFSNISLANAKMLNYSKALDLNHQCLEVLQTTTIHFDIKSQITNKASPVFKFIMKSLLRKAELLEELGNIAEAENAIKECRRMDETNKIALEKMKALRRRKNFIEFEGEKQIYTQSIKDKNFPEALEHINKAEALLDFDYNVLDILKNSLNKCSCFLQMSRNNEVVTECIRGLKILANLRNNIIDKQKIEIAEKNKEELKALQIRFLLRRSSALAKLGQVFNAKKDLEDVLVVDHEHVEARRIIESFKLSNY
jgi:tetratricopeptide (TPR) repeat protein